MAEFAALAQPVDLGSARPWRSMPCGSPRISADSTPSGLRAKRCSVQSQISVRDAIQVGLLAKREHVAAQGVGALFPRFLAMQASKSNDVDGPLASPSTSAPRNAASLVTARKRDRVGDRPTSRLSFVEAPRQLPRSPSS